MHIVLEFLLSLLHAMFLSLKGLVLCCFPRAMKDVSQDIVLVTGAGSGIGKLIAIQLASLGATLVCWDINKEGNEETVQQIKESGWKAKGYVCDVSSREDIYRTAAKVKEEVGKVSILINNAGIVTGKQLLDCPDHLIQRTFDVNALSLFWTTKAFLPDMLLSEKGHIVTIASVAGHVGVGRLVDYCASKFAAVGFNNALMTELDWEGRKGINTTVVCPHYINTGMFQGVKARVLPLLDPEHVASEVVTAILTNQKEIFIPKYMFHLLLLARIVSYDVCSRLIKRMKLDKSMNTFIGRQQAVKE